MKGRDGTGGDGTEVKEGMKGNGGRQEGRGRKDGREEGRTEGRKEGMKNVKGRPGREGS